RKNPYPLIIPCHRVIKSDGSLGGYVGTKTSRKKKLLQKEKNILAQLSEV
ncbi:MAG TPA: MGMT family protein, partial [Candidatus Omnitrophota bacterium]|nr:MGMT family protein [Candidatus Omnitrophota bacterium]